ncbi:MAG TPA: hypothetical protein VLK36_01505 [Gaiellaceae bacterium]|nr:hypothetical protein [Gaiellaceae bacterium]
MTATPFRFFRSRVPVHRILAESGGLTTPRAPAAQPPGFDGEARGEPGIHGIPRARRFDVVTTVQADAEGAEPLRFAALVDGALVPDGAEGSGGPAPERLAPFAEAVDATLDRPYRAEAVPRDRGLWAVAARRIVVVAAPELVGHEAELVSTREGRSLHVDGQPRFGSVPSFEREGQEQGEDYVVRAVRLVGDLWEVEAAAL